MNERCPWLFRFSSSLSQAQLSATMSPAPLPRLPVIDLSPFLISEATSAARAATAESIHQACIKYGFFYITGLDSVISLEEMDDSLAQARAFFARPEADKALLKPRKGDRARGWQRMGQNITSNKGESISDHFISRENLD